MQKINRGEVTKYAFDWRDKPVLNVKQNEVNNEFHVIKRDKPREKFVIF